MNHITSRWKKYPSNDHASDNMTKSVYELTYFTVSMEQIQTSDN